MRARPPDDSAAPPTASSSLSVRSTPGNDSSSKLTATRSAGSSCRIAASFSRLGPRRDEDRHGPAVDQHGGQLDGRQRRVERNVDHADRQAREIRDGPLGSVLGENRDPVARARALLQQSFPDAPHPLQQLAVGDRAIPAASFPLERIRLVVALGGLVKELSERAGRGPRLCADESVRDRRTTDSDYLLACVCPCAGVERRLTAGRREQVPAGPDGAM